MKRTILLMAYLWISIFYLAACKNDKTDTTKTDTTVIITPMPLPDTAKNVTDSIINKKDNIFRKDAIAPEKIKIVLDKKKEADADIRVKKTSKKGRIILELLKMNPEEKIEADQEGVYNRSEIMPTYSGGENALRQFIETHIQYPDNAINNNIEGTVKVYFTVDEQGKIYAPTILSPKLGYGLEEEALRVVRQMPKWVPGQVQGKNVKAHFTLPIPYKIE